jgi:hypothetical protein
MQNIRSHQGAHGEPPPGKWGIEVVKSMFAHAARPNIALHFNRIETALDAQIRLHKISAPSDILLLKIYSWATVRVENDQCACKPEGVSKYNTRQVAPKLPSDFASLETVREVYNALLAHTEVGKPFAKYDYREKTLGNAAAGMGAKYKGRGFIQLTGRKNYLFYAAKARAPEIVENPDRANDPDVAARILAAYMIENSAAILSALRQKDLAKARSVVNGKNPHAVVPFSLAYRKGYTTIFGNDAHH